MSASKRVVVIGAGGFGREVLDVIEAMQDAGSDLEMIGFLDDGSPNVERVERRGHRVLGGLDLLDSLDCGAVIGVGDPQVRARIDDHLLANQVASPTLIHPDATTGADVSLGPGSIVTAGARLTTNIQLGRHAHLNLNCTVGHDVVGGDYLTVNPGATISGEITMGNRIMIGTGASIVQGLHIGDDAVIGAGAAVVKDVASGTTVVGVPAKPR